MEARNRLLRCPNIDVTSDGQPFVSGCDNIGHRLHNGVWWHTPDTFVPSDLSRSQVAMVYCPQKHLHDLMPGRCSLCGYPWYPTPNWSGTIQGGGMITWNSNNSSPAPPSGNAIVFRAERQYSGMHILPLSSNSAVVLSNVTDI